MGQHALKQSADFCARLLALAAALSTSTAYAGASEGAGFYEQKEKGWFWRNVPPEAAKSEPETPLIAPSVPDPEPFSPAWLREKLPEYRDIAIANPTEENVRTYFLLQRYSMDLAERFAIAAQRVVLSDPRLDENNRRPISTYGADVFDQVARQATEDLAKKIATEAGIWYFYRSDCPYCRALDPILLRLAERIGVAVLPIALDGKPLPDGAFPRFVADRGHASQLNVTQTPTLFLVKDPAQFALLSEGLVTDENLITRIVAAAHESGWISDEEYNSTRAVKPSTLIVEGELPTNDLALDAKHLAQTLKMSINP
jgi:conjugal transfer pilus assembly protein TraF